MKACLTYDCKQCKQPCECTMWYDTRDTEKPRVPTECLGAATWDPDWEQRWK